MDGLIAYILAKKIALSAVSGISNISFSGNQIIFHFKDGGSASMTVPLPEDGKDGKDGVDGKDGKDGLNGIDGKDGISIQSVSIDNNSNLICTLSDGTVINAGKISTDSSSIVNVDTTDDLPEKGNLNVLYIVGNSIIYIWTGNEYKSLSSGGGGGDIIGNIQWGSF